MPGTGRSGEIAGWVVAIFTILVAILGVSNRAGILEQRITALEQVRDKDSPKIDLLLQQMAVLKEQLSSLTAQIDRQKP